jgi:hypothetical protein
MRNFRELTRNFRVMTRNFQVSRINATLSRYNAKLWHVFRDIEIYSYYNWHLILVVDQYNHCTNLGDGVCLLACFPVVMI